MTHYAARGLAPLLAMLAVLFATDSLADPEQLLLRPGRLPNAELPAQAANGTGLSGEFNPRALGAHRLAVTLPDGRVLAATRSQRISDPRRGESWVGELEGRPGSSFVLTQWRGAVSGFLHDGPDVWEIASGQGGNLQLYRVDDDSFAPPGPSRLALAPADTQGDGGAGDAITATAADGIVQDLLVLYTTASRQRYGEAGIQSRILSAVAAANQGYANSGLALTLNLVHMAETGYVETGDMLRALEGLARRNDGLMEEAHALRDQYGADLVALVNEDSNYCGIAYVMTTVSTGFASSAFSVTGSTCLSNHTLAHEIGHNQGNMHNREDSGYAGAYPYSYGFRRCTTDGSGFRTVMSYSCSGAARINHFSNPAVSFGGYPTGIDHDSNPASSADAARSMANTAATVAAFRAGAVTSAPLAPAGLAAQPLDARRVALSWHDTADESAYVVERSGNGVSFTQVASLGANTTSYVDNGLEPGLTYWYRVRALNSIGSSPPSGVVAVTMPDLPPVMPGQVSAAAQGSTASVSWTDNSANEDYFEIGREALNAKNRRWSGISVVGTAPANASGWQEQPGEGTFRYSVRAVNAGGTSAWAGPSAEVTTTAGGSTGGSDDGSSGSGGGGGGKGGKPARDSDRQAP